MTTATALRTGYRGSKAHAVDTNAVRNQNVDLTGEGVSLCGWGVLVGDVEFRANGLACKVCARKAKVA